MKQKYTAFGLALVTAIAALAPKAFKILPSKLEWTG